MIARFIRSGAAAGALALIVVASAAPPARAAAPEFSDKVCPIANIPVRELEALQAKPSAAVADLMQTLHRVIDAYDACYQQFTTAGMAQSGGAGGQRISSTSPAELGHYAEVRKAQYLYLSGDYHARLTEYESARDDFAAARKLAKDVLDWKSPTMTVYQSNSVNGALGGARTGMANADVSNYHDAAEKIVKAVDDYVAKLPKTDAPAK